MTLDQAKEKLKEVIDVFGKLDTAHSNPYANGYLMGLKGALEILNCIEEEESMRQQVEWIKVEDKKPEYRVDVLLYEFPYPRIYIGHLEEHRGTDHWELESNSDVQLEDFTHWMPLPEPPCTLEDNKEEEE